MYFEIVIMITVSMKCRRDTKYNHMYLVVLACRHSLFDTKHCEKFEKTGVLTRQALLKLLYLYSFVGMYI